MKIALISNYFKLNSAKNNIQNTQTSNNNYNQITSLTNAYYMPFLGGYSVDLSETYKKLDDADYPLDIKEKVAQTLDSSNPENKTLYDVHFEKYKGINDCFTLGELKEKYPEFKDVQSAYNVIAQDESFVGSWQNGESELFAKEEDLTLQLIKLYWGQGFSLGDLSKYIQEHSSDNKGISLHYAMTKKLNIPMMNQRYASVLKLSNKEYNEKFTTALAEKLKETRERKIQEAEGEPIYIPSTPMPQARRDKISKGLIRHYQEHPEAIYKLSQRQKEFYEKHPEKRQEFTNVLDYAWNGTDEGKSVKKYLSKFMKKRGYEVSDSELVNPQNLPQGKRKTIGEFWKTQGWAKKSFSTAMRNGWEFVKEVELNYNGESIPDKKASFRLYPKGLDKK